MGGPSAPGRPAQDVRTRRLDLRPPAVALLVAALVLHVAYRTSGLRTLALVRLGLVAAVAVNLLWALVVAERVKARVTGNDGDATTGDRAGLVLALDGPRQPVTVAVLDPPGDPWALAEPPASGPLTFRVSVREVRTDVVVAVACHHPFGLVGWVRTRRVPLAQPLAVGPRPAPGVTAPAARSSTEGDAGTGGAAADGPPRSVRDYRPGDPARLVSWRASARAGRLVVRELDGGATAAALLGLHLGAGGPAAEEAAARAAAAGREALGAGWTLLLATVEPAGPVTAPVASVLDLQRRLAAAVPSPEPPSPPPGWPATGGSGAGANGGAGRLCTPEGDRPWP